MKEKRTVDYIHICDHEGKNMIASPKYIRKLLGIDVDKILNRLSLAERKIEKLESPERQQRIIDALYGQGKHNRTWLENRVSFEWYDLRALIKKGILIESQSGTQTMYEFPE